MPRLMSVAMALVFLAVSLYVITAAAVGNLWAPAATFVAGGMAAECILNLIGMLGSAIRRALDESEG